MDDWKIKKNTIKAMIGNNCLFCGKNTMSEAVLKQRKEWVLAGYGDYEDYNRESGYNDDIHLCSECQKRYNLLEEIRQGEKNNSKN